jgi:hypothetical protein
LLIIYSPKENSKTGKGLEESGYFVVLEHVARENLNEMTLE